MLHPMTRVFVSSTCHDLIDLRSEVLAHVVALGFEPVLSDVPETFDVGEPVDSIRTCLANVDASDVFVCILSRRYGPRLGASGFDDVSATHLEYRRALGGGKRILFYVRDRLISALEAWRAGGRTFTQRHPWLEATDASGLSEMCDEQSRLATAQDRSNWYSIFRDSVELKRQLARHLESESATIVLERLADQNRLPQLVISWAPQDQRSIHLRNVGAVAAHDVEVVTGGAVRQAFTVVEPGYQNRFDAPTLGGGIVTVRWRDPAGIAVEEVFRLHPDGRASLHSRRLRSRTSLHLLGPTDPDVPVS
jgi:hypothetical protein